ncbi:hypothetical protein HY632_03500 [Candidatus Uhrbacteria bacterium]|nr:hypothetical protein [Candidatus Uhrbacteria bacterium]
MATRSSRIMRTPSVPALLQRPKTHSPERSPFLQELRAICAFVDRKDADIVSRSGVGGSALWVGAFYASWANLLPLWALLATGGLLLGLTGWNFYKLFRVMHELDARGDSIPAAFSTGALLVCWPIVLGVALCSYGPPRIPRVIAAAQAEFHRRFHPPPQKAGHPIAALPSVLLGIVTEEETSLIGEGSELAQLLATIQMELTIAREVHSHFRTRAATAGDCAPSAVTDAYDRAELRCRRLAEKRQHLEQSIAAIRTFYEQCRAHIQGLAPEIEDIVQYERLAHVEATDDALGERLHAALEQSTGTILLRTTQFASQMDDALLHAGIQAALAASSRDIASTDTIDATIDRFLSRAAPVLALPATTSSV